VWSRLALESGSRYKVWTTPSILLHANRDMNVANDIHVVAKGTHLAGTPCSRPHPATSNGGEAD